MCKSWRIRLVFLALAGISFLPRPLHACSMASCLGRGIELRSSLTVKVDHQERPFQGVRVEVRIVTSGEKESVVFRGETGADGKVVIPSLPPGDYWLTAEKMGIAAAHHCFHVLTRPSRKAKRSLKYDWGDMPYAVGSASGTLVRLQIGDKGTFLEKLAHPLQVPIVGARLELRDPFGASMKSSLTNDRGEFDFAQVPEGRYVISVTQEGAVQPVAFVIQVAKTAPEKRLNLVERVGWPGSCGGIGIERSQEMRDPPA